MSLIQSRYRTHFNPDQFGAPTRTQDQRMLSKEGKMEKSFLNFKARNFVSMSRGHLH